MIEVGNLHLAENITHIAPDIRYVELISKVFEIETPKNSYLKTFNIDLFNYIFESQQIDNLFLSAAITYDFQESLNIVNADPSLPEILRKLVAIGYFAPQISKKPEFISELLNLIQKLKTHLNISSAKNLNLCSFALAFALSSIAPLYSVIDFNGTEHEMLNHIFDIYLFPKILDELTIPLYFDFFIAAFLNIPIENNFKGEEFDLFSHLMKLLISTLTMGFSFDLDYLDLTAKLLSFMASHNLPLQTRIELFKFLISISSKYEEASMMLVDSECSALIGRFICDYITDVPFDLNMIKGQQPINLIRILPKVRSPATSFVEPYFEEAFVPFLHSEWSIRFNIDAPEDPEPMKSLKSVLVLVSLISDLCHSIRFQIYTINHIVFLRTFLNDETFNESPLAPFFVASWVSRLFTNMEQIPYIADYLHNIGFYKKMLNICFLKYTNGDLQHFIISFLMYLVNHCPKANLFITDLIRFFEKTIRTVRMNVELTNCIVIIATMNSQRFIEIVQPLNFVIDLGTYLVMYQETDVHNENTEKLRFNRRLLLKFIADLSIDAELFEYLFTKDAFNLAVMSHFFDVTTVDFALSQIKFAISNFNANYTCVRYIFKFFETKLFKCKDVPHEVLNNIIEFCSFGFLKNPFTIGQIFAESNFLETLVNFSIEIEATISIEYLLDLLKVISTTDCDYNPNIALFLKLSPLIKSRKNMSLTDYLLKIVFGDDKKMEVTRKIKNPGPLSLLLQIYKDDNEMMSKYLTFIQKCFALSMFEIVQTNLPSELIKFLLEYRLKSSKDALFDQALNFLCEIMTSSVTSQDFLSFFQLFTTIPDKIRPFYTIDLLNTLTKIFKNHTSSALTFFGIDQSDKGVELPQIPSDLLNNGFNLTIRIRILERSGTIFIFSNACEFLTLSFDSETFLNLNGHTYEQTLPMAKWFTFTFSYHRSGYFQIFVDDDEIIRENTKMAFKDDFDDNAIALLLKCNIEFVKLEGNKLPFFSFNAYSFCKKYAVDQSLVAEVHGTVFHLPQPPKVVLNAIGGVSILLPLFAQLELLPYEVAKSGDASTNDQQLGMENNYNDNSELLKAIFSLLKEVLYDSPQLQSDFCSSDGFRLVGELLSIISIDKFSCETIIKLFEVYNVITDHDLQKQMIEYVFFNLNIWIYIVEIHDFYFQKMFEMMLDIVRKDSFFISILNVRGILYLMRCYLFTVYDESFCLGNGPKVTIDGKTLAERPTKLLKLRSLFFNFLVQLADITFTQYDLITILYFCFDESDVVFQGQVILLFSELIKKRNKTLLRFLGLGAVQFSSFFELLKSPNPKLTISTVTLFDAIIKGKITKFTSTQIRYKILNCVQQENLNILFLKHLDKANISYSLKIPLFLYNLSVIEEADKVLKNFQNLVSNPSALKKFEKSEYFYYIFLIYAYISKKFDDIFDSLIESLLILCFSKHEPLLKLFKFTEMIEYRIDFDLSPFLRKFFEKALESKIKGNQLISVVSTLYSFIFRIPEFDSFVHLFVDSKTAPKISFFDLFTIMNKECITTISYSFGVRTNFEQDWLDANLAEKLIKIVPNSEKLSSIAEEFSLFMSTGIQHARHAEDFLKYRGKLLSLFQHVKDSTELSSSQRHAFVIFFGGLSRAVLSEDVNQNIIDILQSELHTFQSIAHDIMKSKTTKVDNIFNYFVPLFAEKINKIEEDLDHKLSEPYKIAITALIADTSVFNGLPKMVLPNEQMQTSIKNFATFLNKSKRQSMKKYKQLFQELSSDNGPWTTPENPPIIHYKMDNNTKRTRLVPNLKFNQHKDASLARDLGSYENAQAILKEQIAKMKMKSFAGDFSLIDFDDVEDDKNRKADQQLAPTDKIITKCEAQLITPRKVHSGDLNLTKKMIFFESNSKYMKLSLTKIKKILFRRYLMVDSAIEIFCSFSNVYFINFVSENERLKFLAKVGALKVPNIKFIQRKNDEVKTLALKITEKWQKGVISNFDYLMKLNILAGRSYNDLSQYPVFPWVLSDYTSDKIDLNNPGVYRDFSKPVGAMNETRLSIMRERMNEGVGEETKYLYGSLYSSAAVVIGYLIRMEPFTSLHIQLQSGRFDLTDRLFVSIPAAWDSITCTQMDFRELIPEFFLIPDFLNNVDGFDLGKNINSEIIGDVKLPQWAKSPRDFIEINRIAMESNYVSENLHQWVDLIFGPHSRQPLAGEVDNVFHPYFYETAMAAAIRDDGITVPLLKEYSACFGCCPLKLFDKIPESRSFRKIPLMLKNEGPRIYEFGSQTLRVQSDGSTVIAASQDLQYAVFDDRNHSAVKSGKLSVLIPNELKDVPAYFTASKNFSVLAIPWSTSFSLFVLKNKPNGSVNSFKDISVNSQPISALASSQHYFATASMDCTLRTWKFDGLEIKPISFLAKHDRPVKFIEISERLNAVFSISLDGFVSCISLRDGRYLHGKQLNKSEPSHFAVSKGGYVIAAFNGPDSSNAIVLDQNLEEIARPQFDGAIQCWTPSDKCGKELITFVFKSGKLEIRELPFLIGVEYSTKLSTSVLSIAFTRKPKPRIFVGSKAGNIISLDID